MKKYLSLVLFCVSGLLFSQNYFHDTQGKLEISNSGQAVYTLPVALPPSIQEVGPTVNLVYTSGIMGGIAGQGWSIHSISNISRIATRRDIDGFIDGVDFDNNDKLALDGQRLILISGTYWANGSVYETETKSNTKVELIGSGEDIYFIVTTPDGTRAWYGNYGGMNAVDLTSYYITRYEDVNGNYITYHYNKPFNKSLCISEIRFSANTKGISPLNKVKFFYKLAKRTENVFIKGVKHEKAELLDKIEVETNNQLFRRYQITHDFDAQLGYERVVQIQEFNGNSEPANPVVFEYNNTISENQGTEVITNYNNNLNFNDVELSGDFDGDGRLDFTTNNGLYRNLFQGNSGQSPILLPSSLSFGDKKFRFTATTLFNNKLNQFQSIVKAEPLSDGLKFKVFNLNGATISESYSKTVNLGIPTPMVGSDYTTSKFIEGDFNGDGISELLIISTPTQQPPPDPLDPCHFWGTCGLENLYTNFHVLDLNPNSSTTVGTQGLVKIGNFILNDLIFSNHFVHDFNGDGKSDILLISNIASSSLYKSYKIFSFEQTESYPWVIPVVIGSGVIDAYLNEKQLLFGDYNGDGKVDLMIPNGDGSNAQRNDKLWHIYYSNPKPNGGEFFTKESYEIVEYWPNSGNYFDTQTHFNNFYSLDTNGDGKSDLVRIWRKYYKPPWTINDHDTQWEITTYINNIGNTIVSGTKFPLDYTSPTNHNSDSPDLPIPVVSNFKYQGLNRDIVMVRNHYNQVTYVNFKKDVSQDILLKKAISSGGNIVDEISYEALEPDTPGTNGLGTLNQFYSSADAVSYPFVELKRIPDYKLVSELKNTSMGVQKRQNFRYHGLVVNMNGIGTIGFRKTARSAWYQSPEAKRIWTVEENNPLWRGATQRRYTQLVATGHLFSFVTSGNPTGIISSSVNSFVSNTDSNGVFNIYLDTQTMTDFLTNVKNEILYTYTTPYLLPEKVITKNYLNQTTLQGMTTTITDFVNNPSGSGSSYYIGRPLKVVTTASAYKNTFSTEEKYTYTDNRLTKKESKGNTTNNVYLTESYEYFPNGNLKKKILSAPGAVPAVSARTTEYTYDASQRFIKTVKDIEGLTTTYNTYHPLYGVVLSETNPYGQTTVSVYDNWGKRTKVTDYLNKNINYSYSKSGNYYTTSQSGDDGSASVVLMDALGRVVRKGKINISGQWSYNDIEYDFLNRKSQESEPYFGSSPAQWTTYSYDDYNRLKQQVSYTGLTTNIIYSGLSVTTSDGTSSKTTVNNANGHTVQSTDAGGTINYTYYANGNMKTSNFDGIVLSVEYDEWGRKKKLTDPSAGIYEYEYNIYGETRKEITPKGTTHYHYTPTGRISYKLIAGDDTYQEVYYAYNADKQLMYVDGIDEFGYPFTTEYFYDNHKRLSVMWESNPQSYFEKKFEYDAFGRIDREYYEAADLESGKSSGKWIKNTYLHGYHWQILDGTTNAMLWQIDAVNERGQVLTAHYGNAVGRMSNTYDSYGFPLTSSFRTINGSYASPAPFITLTTNFNAQRGLLQNRSNSMFSWNETFQYDSLDRLTHFTGASGQTEQQDYDNKGRITQNSLGNYSYDITTKPYQATMVDLSTEAASYYADKPFLEVFYNMFKSPISIYEEGKERIDFEYNPFQTRTTMYYGGLQADKNQRPFRKLYSSDGVMEIKRNIAAGTVEFITYIGGDGYTAPLLLKSDGTTQHYMYLHRDYMGSIMAVSNAAGQVIEKRHFDAWGNIVFLKDQNNNNLTAFSVLDRGYTGHEHLQGVGLIHMNGRLYDAKIRRFLSPDNYVHDPTDTQSFNRYGYVFNNPLKYSDPSGEIPWLAIGIGAGVAALTYTVTALVADVPFTPGGLIKSAAIGAFSAAVTFGIGEAAGAFQQLGSKIAFQTLTHGMFQGIMSGVQGGDFVTGFASGSLSSLASSLWSGGSMEKGGAWGGLGGKFSQSTAGILTFGTVAGGAGAALTKGNFWQGAVTGLIVSGLNHAAHKNSINKKIKNIRDRFKKDAGGKYIIDPDGIPDFSQTGVGNLEQNVEGLAAVRAKLNPDLNISFDLTGDYVGITDNEVSIRLNKGLIPKNVDYAVVLFHEYRHAWQYDSGWFGKWATKYGYSTAYNLAERDAYWYQIQIGGGEYYKGYYRYNYYKNLTNHVQVPYIK